MKSPSQLKLGTILSTGSATSILMKHAKLLHNTSAGEEDHEANDLIEEIRSNGFDCSYSSTKKKELKRLLIHRKYWRS